MADGIFDVSDADVERRIKMATGNSAPFTATKFGREYEGTRQLCDEDCAEFLSGVQFEIPYQQQKENDSAKRLHELEDFVVQARDALRDAWAVLECGNYSSLMTTVSARGSVRMALLRAAALDESRP